MKVQRSHKKTAGIVLLAGIIFSPLVILAQPSSDSSTLPRLGNGRPDMQGTWDFRTITPLQRPSSLEGKEFLTEDEFQEFEDSELVRRDRDNFTDTTTTGDYNQFWYDPVSYTHLTLPTKA